MKLHANAALSLKGRRQLCRWVLEERWTVSEAAAAAEVSVRCARKWVGRYRADGELGLLDRSSARIDPASHVRAAGAGDRCAQTASLHWPGDR
jgi:transposase IS481 family protein